MEDDRQSKDKRVKIKDDYKMREQGEKIKEKIKYKYQSGTKAFFFL